MGVAHKQGSRSLTKWISYRLKDCFLPPSPQVSACCCADQLHLYHGPFLPLSPAVLVLVCTGQPLPLAPDVDVAVGQQADLVCSFNATDIIAITIAKVEAPVNESESR